MFWVKERIQFEKWPIYRHKESVVKKWLKEAKEANGFTSTWKSLVYLRIEINFTISICNIK